MKGIDHRSKGLIGYLPLIKNVRKEHVVALHKEHQGTKPGKTCVEWVNTTFFW